MTLRHAIANAIRAVARQIDDPSQPRTSIIAQLQAIHAIPRRVNRYVEKASFSNRVGDRSILDDPLVLEAADVMERRNPGLYRENPDMDAALASYRAGGSL